MWWATLSNPYEKRIEVPLLVQTSTDRIALKRSLTALQEATKVVQSELDEIEKTQVVRVTRENQGTQVWENSAAYSAYIESDKQIKAALEKFGIEPKWDLIREIYQGLKRPIWNDAIELAAQVTGGAAGTLIRDLKEDEKVWK